MPSLTRSNLGQQLRDHRVDRLLGAGVDGGAPLLERGAGLVDRLDGTGLAVLRAEPYDLALPGGGDPVPAYRLTFNTTTQIGATP